ncbi:MAG: BLUF domain-containing protein [Bradymonadia bacterium]
MTIRQLVYTSLMTIDDSKVADEIKGIIDGCTQRNPALGITGCLMFSGRRVVQFLEGPVDSVDPLYEKICRDQRHTQIACLYLGESETREIPDWAMALCDLGAVTEDDDSLKHVFAASQGAFKFHMNDFRALIQTYLFEPNSL